MNPVLGLESAVLTFGGGVRLYWINPDDLTFNKVKILRKTTNTFSGPNDTTAKVVYENGRGMISPAQRPLFVINGDLDHTRFREAFDHADLAWNQTYYYAIYAMDAGASDVSTAVIVSVTLPEFPTFEDVDLLDELRAFLRGFFKQAIASHVLPVRAAITGLEISEGPPRRDQTQFPCISLHLAKKHPIQFVLGDILDTLDDAGEHPVRRQGCITEIDVEIVGWAGDNPETRHFLHRVLEAAMLAIKPLLSELGFSQLSWSGSYEEDISCERYDIPMFWSAWRFRANQATTLRRPVTEPSLSDIQVTPPALTVGP